MHGPLLSRLPASFHVGLHRYLQIFFSLYFQPWHQAPFPDRLATAQPCCLGNTSLLALRIYGRWAGLASGTALISAVALSWPAFWMCTSLPVWFSCFLLCRISSLISWCYAFWFSTTMNVYFFKTVYFSHVKGFWIRMEIFLVHYFNPIFYILLYNCFPLKFL